MIERNFLMWEWETVPVEYGELTLKSLERKIIEADPIDDFLPEWEWIFMDFLLQTEKQKKSFQLSILSEPYESITEHRWKEFTIQIKKVKDYTVKVKIYINEK